MGAKLAVAKEGGHIVLTFKPEICLTQIDFSNEEIIPSHAPVWLCEIVTSETNVVNVLNSYFAKSIFLSLHL